MSWFSPIRRQRLTIFAEKGTVSFDDKAKRKLVLYGEDGVISHPDYKDEAPLRREMRAFIQLVRSGAADPSQIESDVAIVRMIATAEDSISRGGMLIKI